MASVSAEKNNLYNNTNITSGESSFLRYSPSVMFTLIDKYTFRVFETGTGTLSSFIPRNIRVPGNWYFYRLVF